MVKASITNGCGLLKPLLAVLVVLSVGGLIVLVAQRATGTARVREGVASCEKPGICMTGVSLDVRQNCSTYGSNWSWNSTRNECAAAQRVDGAPPIYCPCPLSATDYGTTWSPGGKSFPISSTQA
jgi:hypothetical protein